MSQETAISAADKAFAATEPYTPNRVVAAQAMGLHHPNNISPDGLEQFNRTGIYPGMLQDVLIVLWLCSLEKDTEIMRAMRSPDEAINKAIAWGADNGVTDTKSEAWWKAYNRFIDIMTGISASAGVPELPDSGDDDEDTDEKKD